MKVVHYTIVESHGGSGDLAMLVELKIVQHWQPFEAPIYCAEKELWAQAMVKTEDSGDDYALSRLE